MLKLDNIRKIGYDKTIYSCCYLFLCSFHWNEKTNFPWKWQFQLEAYSTSIYRIFSNGTSLKLSLFAVQNDISFLWNSSETFFIVFFSLRKLKSTRKISHKNIFWHYRKMKQNFENLWQHFVTRPLNFQTNFPPSIYSWWLSRYRTQKPDKEEYFLIKTGMSFSISSFSLI